MKTLFIINDPPYGTERVYNALRLAQARARRQRQGAAVRNLHGRPRPRRGGRPGGRAPQHDGRAGGDNHGGRQGASVLTMRIYLDYNASTPIDPAVAAAMRPFLADHYGNPSSGHWAAATAKAALETARGQVAALLGCRPDEIVFTSGGSEANNFALKGVFFALREKGDHIVTTRIEHPAILEPCRFLERLGARVSYL